MSKFEKAALSSLFLMTAILTGCGQQGFVATSSVEAKQAPGVFTVPAKVDILLVEEDRGRMYEALPQIQNAMPAFLSSLQAQGWDYHFAVAPLTMARPLYQVAGSSYDPNWGSEWTAPFPGADINQVERIHPSYFVKPDNFSSFISRSDVSNALNGMEPGLNNIARVLQSYGSNTGFLRDDAILVVLVVGTGQDTSLVNYCPRTPGNPSDINVPCENTVTASNIAYPECTEAQFQNMVLNGASYQCRSAALSLAYHQSWLTSFKPGSPGMVKFYAAVSNQTTGSCLGGAADKGSRYQSMASMLGGHSFDICDGTSNAVTSALNSIGSNLKTVRISMQTHYLPISRRADLGSIVVTRNDGVVIPQSSTNGWTYADTIISDYAIDYPVNSNYFTGYAVELHGAYKLSGNQTAVVTYTTQGLHNSN